MMPVDVQTSPDGTELKKIYDVDAKTSPDQIPQDDFERGGMQYTFQDLLRIEMPDIDRRVHSETVTVSSSSNNSKDVLSLLPESKQVICNSKSHISSPSHHPDTRQQSRSSHVLHRCGGCIPRWG